MAPKLLTEIEPARPAQGDKPAASPVFRAAYAPKGPKDLGVNNLRELFDLSVSQFASRPCLGSRTLRSPAGPAGDYEFLTYKEVGALVAQVHGGYAALGLKTRDPVGIIGANSPEWMIALQGINRLNGVCVPLYDTFGEPAVDYVIRHAGVRLVVTQAVKLPLIASLLSKGTKEVVTQGVVYWGKAAPEPLKVLADAGVKVVSWDELLGLGKASAAPPAQDATLEDVCTIMYTSGTTGNPKGVVLSHRAVLATISGLQGLLDQVHEDMGPSDVYFSFLTMAHIFGRVAEEFMLHIGASIGYWQGDVKKLLDDVDALKPTLFAGVPRVFERIYHGVLDSVKKGGFLKGLIFKYAFYRKLWYLKQGWKHDQASVISDLLVFHKIKARLGGRVRLIVTGGAPIPAHVEEFLKVTMCAPVVQGYGLTESCAASFIQFPYDVQQDFTVGPPMPQTELRLEAVPDLGYSPTSDPPRGEVCLRGPGIFKGYYKEPAMTKEVLDDEGFFHTGDIGEITPSGALRLIDRKKNLFKLSHGEYIAVETVENRYKESEYVEQLFVYGNSFESCLVAILVPREGPLRKLAEEEGISGAADAPLKDLLSNSTLNAAVLKKLQATGRAGKLKGFEEIKAIYLEEEPFSVDNDLMTPSFKLKRAPLQKRYKAEIDALYAKLKAAGAAS